MQSILFNRTTMEIEEVNEAEWRRIARRECLAYGEHGVDMEITDGQKRCFNCGGNL